MTLVLLQTKLCTSVKKQTNRVVLWFVLQICGLDEQLQYELAFPLALLFWYVVVACHVAGRGQTLSLAQECGHEAAYSPRSEEADP